MYIQLCIDKRKAMFIWTEKKNRTKKIEPTRKNMAFTFPTIVDVFNDLYLLEVYDAAHSSLDEDRYINIGRFHDAVILFIVTTDMADGNTRIITAREATPREQEIYNDYYRKSTNSGGN
jgi:uncharacterized DUF497 family protein